MCALPAKKVWLTALMAALPLGLVGTASAATSTPGGVVVNSANAHAYELVLDSSASWTQAESTATAAGGYLVSPTSQSEDAFVDQILDLPDAGYSPGNGQFTGDLIRAGYVVEWDSASAAGSGISASATPAAVPLPNAAFLFMTGACVAVVAVRRATKHRI